MRRPELDQFKGQTICKAATGQCDGSCDEHHGEVRAFRVHHEKSGNDWGYFAYCESAQEEDKRRGMILTPAESDGIA